MVISALGNTPTVTLSKLIEPGRVFVKLEKNNPAGSVKDRPAYFMIVDAEARGLLDPTDPKCRTIVEPTSGNTGIALAMVGTAKGYRVMLTMPESMSVERRRVLEMLGAELVLTPADEGMKGAVERAKELVKELGAFMPDQFSNPTNVLSHESTTAPEILRQMSWQLDAFVAGVGTGGTISGVGTVLKRLFGDSVLVVAVKRPWQRRGHWQNTKDFSLESPVEPMWRLPSKSRRSSVHKRGWLRSLLIMARGISVFYSPLGISVSLSLRGACTE